MPRSDAQVLAERLERTLRAGERFVDFGVQLRLVTRNPDGTNRAVKGRCEPEVYGGRFDRLLRRYIGPPERIRELTVTEPQLEALKRIFAGDETEYILLGAPGAGKSHFIVTWGAIVSAVFPNRTMGLLAPTNDRRRIVQQKLLQLIRPFGWIDQVSETEKTVRLKNNVVWEILATKAPSKELGSPVQGRSFWRAGKDEGQSMSPDEHREVATRGREAGDEYKVVVSATNQIHLPNWRVYLEKARADKDFFYVHAMPGLSNAFTDKAYWERLRATMPEREYEALILGKDVLPEHLVYGAFRYTENIRQIPPGWVDITRKVTNDIFQVPYEYVVGQDFGVLTNASVILKCYQDPHIQPNDPGKGRTWWAIDEITTRRTTAEVHAHEILKKGYLRIGEGDTNFIVVADPHHNTSDVDKSDYAQFVNMGITIRQARAGKILVKHRLNMMNTMFCDANGKRRFFVAADVQNHAQCPKLVSALLTMQFTDGGAPEGRKDITDMSHWPCAVGYGIYPWEKVRAQTGIQVGGRSDVYGKGSPLNHRLGAVGA